MLKTKHLKASSLANAIFICLVISIFCGSLVLVSHYQNIIERQLEMKNYLISRNNSSFNHFINNLETLTYNTPQKLDVFDDGIYSYSQKKNWGFYDILISKTVFKKDTVSKTALIGERDAIKNRLALYTTNYDKPLKVSGKVTILGDSKVPNGRIEQVYINNKTGNKVAIKGRQQKSKDRLPKIDKTLFLDFSNYKQLSLENEKTDTIVNSFENETKVFNVDGYNLDRLIGKGNIVLISNSELRISASTKLHDVLIIAPRVSIASGFRGNLQIVAKQEVTVSENVSLLYPSSIYVENDTDSVSVKIKKNSTLVGGIVLNGKTYTGSLKRTLEIDEQAKVVGNIYCYGRTQLKGEIIGNIYTDRFFTNTKSSKYENLILNASINRDSLPKTFVGLNLFNNVGVNKTYASIKTF